MDIKVPIVVRLTGTRAEEGAAISSILARGIPYGREPRLRYVQVGSISGNPISLNADWLRSSGVELLGSGLGSLSAVGIVEALKRMFEAQAAGAGLKIEAEAVGLQQVGTM